MNTKKTSATLDDYGILIYKNIHGSIAQGTAYGTDFYGNPLPGYEQDPRLSDKDITGIFVPHKKHIFGTKNRNLYPLIDQWDEWSDPSAKDNKYLSLIKFIRLLYGCNPNITEQLFVRPEHILFMSEEGRQLREEIAPLCITKESFEKFASYARHQALLMERGHNNNNRGKATSHVHYYALSGEENFDLKAFSHLLRLEFQNREMLKFGTLSTYLREEDRQACIRVKHFGLHPWKDEKLTLAEAHRIAEQLYAELQELLLVSTLPSTPDFDRINNWVSDTIERVHGGVVLKQNYRLSPFHVLPFEHQMLEETTLLLANNPIAKAKSNANAFGICLPYREFFTGLRSFEQGKLGDTKIDSLHKALNRMENCNPTLIDAIFASADHLLIKKDPFAEEMITRFKSLITRDQLYRTTLGVVKGNLKEMQQWEKEKSKWENEKQNLALAKERTLEYYENKKAILAGERSYCIEECFKKGPEAADSLAATLLEFEAKQQALTKETDHWYKTKDKKLTKYPPCPEGTDPSESSYMHRFGYNTVRAAFVYHVLSMSVELMQTGTLQDSRAFEGQMKLIREGQFITFEQFEQTVTSMLETLTVSKSTSPLPAEVDHRQTESWLVDFIDRFHAAQGK